MVQCFSIKYKQFCGEMSLKQLNYVHLDILNTFILSTKFNLKSKEKKIST